MIHAFLTFVIGIIAGFCSSTPPGPINMWLVDQTLSSKKIKSTAFLTGVILSDILFALLASWGYVKLLEQKAVLSWVKPISGFFLILIGFFAVLQLFYLKEVKKSQSNQLNLASSFKNFSIGLAMCGSNPAFLLFWIFIIDQSKVILGTNIEGINTMFLCCGIAVGDIIWFKSLIYLVNKGKEQLDNRIIFRIRLAIAIIFIGSGFFALVR